LSKPPNGGRDCGEIGKYASWRRYLPFRKIAKKNNGVPIGTPKIGPEQAAELLNVAIP
jgi:hypothetical protein